MLGEIIDLAIQKKMCLDYFTELKDCKNIDSAIPLYLKNPNWSLKKKFLSLTFIRKYLSNKTKQGIYVDYYFEDELLNEKQVYILHACKGKIRVALNVEKQIIPMFYLANGSEVEIVIEGNIKVPIKRYE